MNLFCFPPGKQQHITLGVQAGRLVAYPALVAALSLMILLSVHDPCSAGNADARSQPIDAIWRVQQIAFVYRADPTRYPCAMLGGRIIALLREVGARVIAIDVVACRDFSPLQRLAITIAAPVEATDVNLHAATLRSSGERLLAELRGTPSPTVNDIARFPAHWQTTSLGRPPQPRLRSADCALLREMIAQVLPRLSVRVLSGLPHCSATRAAPKLIVDALIPGQADSTTANPDFLPLEDASGR